MTAGIVLRCDGTRARQPCATFLPTLAQDPRVARAEAAGRGWTPGAGRDLCPACTAHPELS